MSRYTGLESAGLFITQTQNYMSQGVCHHQTGITAATAVKVSANVAAGANTLSLSDTSLTGKLVKGDLIKIGPTEFKLLNYLMKHPERVHSRAQLLDKVWGDHVFIEERTVDVHVKRLRESLGVAGVLIETVRGAGYRFSAQAMA